MFEQGAQPGQHYALGTRWLPTLTDDAIDVLAEAASSWQSPSCLLAAPPVPRRRYPGRPGRDRVRAAPRARARGGDRRVAAARGRRGQPRLGRAGRGRSRTRVRCPAATRTSSDPQDAARVRLGFGANADRLLAAKRRYDPDGVLRAIASLAT